MICGEAGLGDFQNDKMSSTWIANGRNIAVGLKVPVALWAVTDGGSFMLNRDGSTAALHGDVEQLTMDIDTAQKS